MTTLWGKGEGSTDRLVERFTIGSDPELDRELAAFDALASAAHARMLASIGTLTGSELAGLLDELRAIATEAAAGSFEIAQAEEDCHTAIENRLTAKLGEAGRKIHTGRSRNDQVIAALRLWGREATLELTERLLDVVRKLDQLARAHAETSFPGSTHTRQAMPSTFGHYFGAGAETLLEQIPWLSTAYDHLNRSPLGSASGFGVALPLDRPQVARTLGLESVQVNTLAVQNDRGRTEALCLGVAAAVATDLGRLATDLIRFSSEEVGFVELDQDTTTGSSIMPQKRNPDVLEIIRASAARCRALAAEVAGIYGSLGFGYHRDLQLTKAPFLRGLTTATDCCRAMKRVLDGLCVDADRCRQSVLPATAATDAVYERVVAGEAFRDAYRQVAQNPESASSGKPAESWRARTHLGAPGDLDPTHRAARSEAAETSLQERQARVREVWDAFLET